MEEITDVYRCMKRTHHSDVNIIFCIPHTYVCMYVCIESNLLRRPSLPVSLNLWGLRETSWCSYVDILSK